ncbi:YwpF-like family protein [Terribacillus sp. DMT04]|uniref:YwpF-like family protein n=1 Tax=Terribacillus sp. DMT04 TaxID=2850441 RepID=UPI001C2C1AF7|nr:YwpF-like family protein [Terribacillus sp. DMT04]QXE02935.1 YwpF-like family protein [Terribacillus sp. DMT04]
MKTFKLAELILYPTNEDSLEGKEMQLTEGLIINKEEDNEWVLEAVLDKKDLAIVSNLSQDGNVVLAQVRITKPENRPALFLVQVQEVNDLEEEGNVIMRGNLRREDRSDLLMTIQRLRKEGKEEGEILLSGTDLTE